MKPFTSIAIIGGGICGLATALRCLHSNADKIAIFDVHRPGTNPNGIEAGLLHPFPGMRARAIPGFDELRCKTMRLLKIAQKEVDRPIFATCGLFRIANTPERERDFQRAADRDSSALFPADLSDFIPSRDEKRAKGLWLPTALAVHMPSYQMGLWRYLKSKGVMFVNERVENIAELLKTWSMAIIANGYGAAGLKNGGCFKPLRGQWFILKIPDGSDRLKIGLSDRAYAFPIPGKPDTIFAGATFEHTEQLIKAPDSRGEQLLSDCRELIDIPGLFVQKYGSSLRCTRPDHLPVCRWISDRIGLITAMGSKGLIRHADCADQLISSHLFLSAQ